MSGRGRILLAAARPSQNVAINRSTRRVTITVNVTNPRHTTQVVFNADGSPAVAER